MGTAFSLVQYGKYTESRRRWRGARERLEQLLPSANSWQPKPKKDEKNKESRKKKSDPWAAVSKFPLHWLWTGLNAAVLLVGIALISVPYKIQKRFQAAPTTTRIEQANPVPVKVQQ